MTSIGKNIKQIRIKNNMTQEELAEALFVTRQTISNYETGKSNPDIDTIIKIAELFKVDANTVIYGLPIEAHQKRNRSWAIGCGIFLIVLLITTLVIDKIFEEYTGYYPPPEVILKFSLFPLTYFVVGFYTMHLIGLFTPLKPINNLAGKIIRILILLIILASIPSLLYYTTFSTYSFIRQLGFDLPHIRWYVYYNEVMRFAFTIILLHPYVFAILGALSWLFGLIYRQKN